LTAASTGAREWRSQPVQSARQCQADFEDVDALFLRKGLVGGFVLIHAVVEHWFATGEVGIRVVDQIAEQREKTRVEIGVRKPLRGADRACRTRWCVDRETCRAHIPGNRLRTTGARARMRPRVGFRVCN